MGGRPSPPANKGKAMTMSDTFGNLFETARNYGITPEALSLAEITLQLQALNSTMSRIAEALESDAPWPVQIER
jgi:hypothetical protein